MLSTRRAIYLTIYVSDLTTSRQFYEHALGYRVLEADAASVTYSAGHMLLHLNSAAAYGITLGGGKDRSIALTFLVDDLEAMRAALERRGVRVTVTLTSKAGAMADLYDPDGHWISLYQPSATSLSWPSGAKIEALRATDSASGGDNTSLDGHELLYLFLFVDDLVRTSTFYRDVLGLRPVEITPCHRGVTSTADGVVKYDIGGGLLTTHHVGDGDHAAIHKVATHGSAGVALGFHTTELRRSIAELKQRGVAVREGPVASGIGATALFVDPGGHRYYFCEPLPQAPHRPSGSAIARIMAASL